MGAQPYARIPILQEGPSACAAQPKPTDRVLAPAAAHARDALRGALQSARKLPTARAAYRGQQRAMPRG